MSFEEERSIHRLRGWIATIVTLLVLAFIGFFAYRVLYFAEQIRNGDIDVSTYSFGEHFSVSATLANATIADGEFDVMSTDDPSLGVVGAPVTIVEFADFGCPYSRESSFVMRELATLYPTQVHYVYRDFPITELHPIAQKASEAGECAREQDKFWEFHDKMYQNQSDLSEETFVEFAQALNMNVSRFESCLTSGRHAQEVLQDYQDGVAAGVVGTPTFFINGNKIPGAIPAEILNTIVQAILTNN
jgi:protein-disulfide isomerase